MAVGKTNRSSTFIVARPLLLRLKLHPGGAGVDLELAAELEHVLRRVGAHHLIVTVHAEVDVRLGVKAKAQALLHAEVAPRIPYRDVVGQRARSGNPQRIDVGSVTGLGR